MCTNMGGSGGKSGMKSGGSAKASKPSYFKESEKAVQLQANFQRRDTGAEYSKKVWIPKSQLTEDGRPSRWIEGQKQDQEGSYVMSWQDSKGKKFGSGMTQREKEYAQNRQKRFESGAKSYNDLLSKAKSMGIKGVRKGMKRSTIQRKIDEFEEKKKK
ncbi:hypothetical protein C805_00086 [Eubacterium sp. 14-2]|uniref:hypothetical protein n=1 Tax=Eubacterium sp. 14-2 TaxID=1235790 RepID=UPI00033C4FD0|nr:hypothetical protein [Eubacterium sp. 14-2]EOT29502.1 hypothetical protein C805_00086 [Eubacterium sp. 14-2]